MDKREAASAIKAELGCLAGLVGGLLLVAVIPLTAWLVMLAVIYSDQAHDDNGVAYAVGIGVLIGLLGAFLCYASWRLLKSAAKSAEAPRSGTTCGQDRSKHVCPHCGAQILDGCQTCRWCGADQDSK